MKETESDSTVWSDTMEYIVPFVCGLGAGMLGIAFLSVMSGSKPVSDARLESGYLFLDYNLDGRPYKFIFPYNRMAAARGLEVYEKDTMIKYMFHPGVIPPLTDDFDPKGFIIIDRGSKTEYKTHDLSKISHYVEWKAGKRHMCPIEFEKVK